MQTASKGHHTGRGSDSKSTLHHFFKAFAKSRSIAHDQSWKTQIEMIENKYLEISGGKKKKYLLSHKAEIDDGSLVGRKKYFYTVLEYLALTEDIIILERNGNSESKMPIKFRIVNPSNCGDLEFLFLPTSGNIPRDDQWKPEYDAFSNESVRDIIQFLALKKKNINDKWRDDLHWFQSAGTVIQMVYPKSFTEGTASGREFVYISNRAERVSNGRKNDCAISGAEWMLQMVDVIQKYIPETTKFSMLMKKVLDGVTGSQRVRPYAVANGDKNDDSESDASSEDEVSGGVLDQQQDDDVQLTDASGFMQLLWGDVLNSLRVFNGSWIETAGVVARP